MTKKMGWIPDRPDHRDRMYSAGKSFSESPARLTLYLPDVYDQGVLGSCTANGVSALFQFTEREQDNDAPIPSRLSLYYFTRLDQGTVAYDSGASIRGAIKAAAKHGMCKETTWPYRITKYKQAPDATAMSECRSHVMGTRAYGKVAQNVPSIKAAVLAKNPVVFGFSVYESFMGNNVAKTGLVPMPAPSESVVGGHCMLIIGYDEPKKSFIVRNSWGKGWGKEGNCYMPYDFISNSKYCSDFWTIFEVTPLTP